jgi:hypothetical protein
MPSGRVPVLVLIVGGGAELLDSPKRSSGRFEVPVSAPGGV